jgi:outer membrane protein
MNYKFALLAALVAGLVPVAAVAQADSAAPQPAAAPAAAAPAAAQPAPIVPKAIPAKIALIAFEQAVINTNEGQQALDAIKKKYQPQKAKLDTLSAEIDSLQKQLQAAPATLSDEERASRTKTIDTKSKQLQREGEDAQTAYNTDLQEAYGKVAQKVNTVLRSYVEVNGYTLLLDVSSQQSPVMWATPNTDITEAVINAYNASSGVAAPAPSAPTAARRPAATTPHTAPKPAAK